MHALQRLHSVAFYKWSGRMNRSYRAGIMLLLVGMTISLIPPHHVGWGRWLAIGMAIAASLLELFWIAAIWLLNGSPTMAFDTQLDQTPADAPFGWLRNRRSLRYLARWFVPLARIERTAEERAPANLP
jgi:hypothetical protein